MRGYLRYGMLLCALTAWGGCTLASDTIFRLPAEDWSRPRTGQTVVRLPGLADAMRDYLRNPQRLIRIRHPKGEDGLLWAEELRAWLVSFGIESTRIDLRPGKDLADVVEISLIMGL